MFGSIDCYHWKWDNCPRSHHGAYQNRSGDRSLILQLIAVSVSHCRIRTFTFGCPILARQDQIMISLCSTTLAFGTSTPRTLPSPLSSSPSTDTNSRVPIFWPTRNLSMTSRIYPHWEYFMTTVGQPTTHEASRFKQAQEAVRKDVERAIGPHAHFRCSHHPVEDSESSITENFGCHPAPHYVFNRYPTG